MNKYLKEMKRTIRFLRWEENIADRSYSMCKGLEKHHRSQEEVMSGRTASNNVMKVKENTAGSDVSQDLPQVQ